VNINRERFPEYFISKESYDDEMEEWLSYGVDNNLSEDEQTDWTLAVSSMRFFDADGVATTEDGSPVTDDSAEFEIQEAGTDEELDISLASSNPDSTDIIVDTDSDTNDVTVMVADLEADDNDIELDRVVVLVETTSGTTTDVVDDARVVIDGQSFKAESIGTETDDDLNADGTGTGLASGNSEKASATTSVWYVFDIDGDVTIDEGDEVQMEVVLDFNDTNDGARYTNGTIVKASVTTTEKNEWEAEGADDLANGQFSGTAVGDEHTLIAEGIYVPVDGFDFEISKVDADGNIYQYQVDFDVTAVEGDFYINDLASQASTSPASGVVYSVSPGTAGVTSFISSTADEDSTSGAFLVRDGESETFTLTVTVNPDAAGTFRAQLGSIFYTTNSDGTSAVETYSLTPTSDFRTTPQSIAN